MTDDEQPVSVLDTPPAQLPQVVAFTTASAPIVAHVQTLAVKDDEDESAATEVLAQIKGALNGAEAARKTIVGPIKQHAKMIDETFKESRAPLEEAERILKQRILAYRQQQERERQEEIQRQLAEQREREEQEQRDREAAAAELYASMKALDDDALQQIVVGGRENERPMASRVLQERRAERIAEGQAQLDVDGADALAPEDVTAAGVEHIAQAEAAPLAPAPIPVPLDLPPARPSVTRTASGSAQTRKRWKFEVTDAMQVPRQYLMVDDRLLRAAVADGEREIPGVRIYQEDDLAVRVR